MKQQINLYLPELRRRKDGLDAAAMGKMLLVAILLLAGLSGWRYWGLVQRHEQLEDARRALDLVTRETNQLEAELGRRAADESLARSIRELEQGLQSKRVLLDFLEAGTPRNTTGFSGYLEDLARYLVADLQLTRVALQAGGESVRLGGRVRRPESVPLYLQNLRQGRAYQGMSFETLRIEGDQATELLQFDVASRARR